MLNVTGTWTYNTAVAWIVTHERNAARAIGIVTALQFLPLLFFGAWAGGIADRVNRRALLATANGAAAAIALVTAILVSTGHRSLLVLGATALALGMTTVFETPARQTMLGDLVDPEDVPSAVGLNGATMTGSRVLGSAIAGLLIATIGEAACIYLNALSFLATVIAVVMMDPSAASHDRTLAAARGGVRDGLAYVRARPSIRLPLISMAIVGTLALNQQVTTPLVAREVFDAGPGLFALFGVCSGVGALSGTLAMGRLRVTSSAIIGKASMWFGVGLLAFALAPWVVLSLAAIAASAFAQGFFISTTNARLQTQVDDAYRGRVMSLYAILFLGSTPIGSVIVSAVASAVNVQTAVAIGALAALASGGYVTARSRTVDVPATPATAP